MVKPDKTELKKEMKELTGDKTSFAATFDVFGKLTEIESRTSVAILNSKVPWGETRKYLKAFTSEEAQMSSLGQFITDLFNEVGHGSMEVIDKSSFYILYEIENSPVARMYQEDTGKRSCYATVDAISRFFTEDLEIPCTVTEEECINEGADSCIFSVELQPLATFQVVFDDVDNKIMLLVDKGVSEVEEIVKDATIPKEEYTFRHKVLSDFQIIDEETGGLTEAGEAYLMYLRSPLRKKEEEFSPPWKHFSELSGKIAGAKSFAEAFSEISEEEELPWMVDEAEFEDLTKKAQSSTSFAEMMSGMSFEDDGDD